MIARPDLDELVTDQQEVNTPESMLSPQNTESAIPEEMTMMRPSAPVTNMTDGEVTIPSGSNVTSHNNIRKPPNSKHYNPMNHKGRLNFAKSKDNVQFIQINTTNINYPGDLPQPQSDYYDSAL